MYGVNFYSFIQVFRTRFRSSTIHRLNPAPSPNQTPVPNKVSLLLRTFTQFVGLHVTYTFYALDSQITPDPCLRCYYFFLSVQMEVLYTSNRNLLSVTSSSMYRNTTHGNPLHLSLKFFENLDQSPGVRLVLSVLSEGSPFFIYISNRSTSSSQKPPRRPQYPSPKRPFYLFRPRFFTVLLKLLEVR